MFRALIDTCVWLDLAKDHKQQPVLAVLEELIEQDELQLILPGIVVDEFARNKARVAEESSRSLSSALKRAKDIVDRLGAGRGKRLAIAHLNELDYRLPHLGEAATDSIGRIEGLFARSTVTAVDDAVIVRAARRGLDRRAPFHRQRNGMDDSILFEVYLDALSAALPRERFAFVTHNTKDFSQVSGDTRLPHSDLSPHFSKIRSLYLTNLAELLKRVAPSRITDAMIEVEWSPEPRRLAEILTAVDELTDKVWYGRHGLLRDGVESGRIKLVDKETFPRDPKNPTVQRDIWKGARKAGQRVEHLYGVENLGPWDDFDWGMLNGKLSALRWVLGDEWDMLDT